MSKTIFLAAAAALALVAGLDATASAQTTKASDPGAIRTQREQQAAQAVAQALAQNGLAHETPYINGSDGSKNKISVTNQTTRDVWMTFYKDQWQHHGQAGQACVPPTQTITFAYSGWEQTGGGDLRGELKSGAGCGGDSLQDKVLAGATGAPIYSGGTAKLLITNPSGNINDFQGRFTP